MYIRWTNFKCPFCKTTWSSRVVSAPRPDREILICGKCKRDFKTHDIEWAHMTRRQKIGYVLNEWMVGWLLFYVMVMIVVVAMVFGGAAPLGDYLLGSTTVLALSAVMLGPFVVAKWLTIRRSKRRTAACSHTNLISSDHRP